MVSSIELGIDIETFSSVDIKNGAYAYSEAPDFEVLLISYKFSDEDEIKLIDLIAEEPDDKDARRAEEGVERQLRADVSGQTHRPGHASLTVALYYDPRGAVRAPSCTG